MAEFDIHSFLQAYRVFDEHTAGRLTPLYHPQITFVDPIHRLQGIAALSDYFATMAQGISKCRFEFNPPVKTEEGYLVAWQMVFCSKALRSGELIRVDGISQLTVSEGKVIFHRDYYDVGAMVYEHVPVLGGIVRWLKRKLQPVTSAPSPARHASVTGGR